MHEMPGVGHCTAESLTDGLMPQTDTEKGDAARQLPHSRLADAGLRRPAGAGGEDQMAGGQAADLFHTQLIVAHYPNVGVEAADELIEIVGKAVIVIDQQNHRSASFCASSSAFTTALALLIHSKYSFSGTESATIPAPDRINTFPFFRKARRMAIQVSILPVKSR